MLKSPRASAVCLRATAGDGAIGHADGPRPKRRRNAAISRRRSCGHARLHARRRHSQGNLAARPVQGRLLCLARPLARACRQVRAFRDHLAGAMLEDVVPVWQLIRTSSSWRECGAERFEVAPADKWDNIVTTLAFVRDEVRPTSARSRRSPPIATSVSTAARTAPRQSAHRHVLRARSDPGRRRSAARTMIREHLLRPLRRHGRDYETGLGFYSGMRFHVDSSGFRRWGPTAAAPAPPA